MLPVTTLYLVLALPVLHLDLACNDYGHVISEDVCITSIRRHRAHDRVSSTCVSSIKRWRRYW